MTSLARALSSQHKDRMKQQTQTSLYDLTLAELEATLVTWGAPKYRAKQIFGWAYDRLEHVASPDGVRAVR